MQWTPQISSLTKNVIILCEPTLCCALKITCLTCCDLSNQREIQSASHFANRNTQSLHILYKCFTTSGRGQALKRRHRTLIQNRIKNLTLCIFKLCCSYCFNALITAVLCILNVAFFIFFEKCASGFVRLERVTVDNDTEGGVTLLLDQFKNVSESNKTVRQLWSMESFALWIRFPLANMLCAHKQHNSRTWHETHKPPLMLCICLFHHISFVVTNPFFLSPLPKEPAFITQKEAEMKMHYGCVLQEHACLHLLQQLLCYC